MVAAPTRAVTASTAPPSPSGTRSGVLVGAASAVSIVLNYVFLLVAGRVLGSAGYGSLAALLGLLAVVVIPAGALQLAVSREVSRRIASGDPGGADAFTRTAVRASLLATVPLVALALVLAVPLSNLLHIDSVGLVVLTEAMLVTALVNPVAMGVIQGVQRFRALAALYLAPFLIRLPLFGIAAALGYRLGAAIGATLVGAVVSTVISLALIRAPLIDAPLLPRAELRPFLRYLKPVVAGLVGIALLTHLDILIVKARLSADDAGAYAAASAFARVGFFLPATILAVLIPRTAARQARGEETEDILGRSLLVTIAVCGALALFYAAAGVGLVTATFGRSFAEGGRVLAPFALAMGLYSVAYIFVGYHLSRGESRYAWITAAGCVVQVAALALVPGRLHSIVWANLAVAGALVVSHELFVARSGPALRAGMRHFTAGRAAQLRQVVVETTLVLLGATAFVCVLMWPVVIHLGSTITGSLGSDSTGSVTWLWTLQHETGYHLLGTTHHTMSGAPLGWDEGNGLNIQWFLPYYPAYLATKLFGPVAAYNLITLAGYVLSGASMYLLTRYLGCTRLVCAWAALVFIVFPWHMVRAEHASLTHLEVLALLVLALVAATRRPTWVRFGFVGAATLACWLTSGYFGGMAVVTTSAFALGAALVSRGRHGWLLASGSTGAALIASGLVAIGSYASGANAGAGIHRDATALQAYGLRPVELVVPAARHLVFGLGLDSFWARHAHGSNTTEISNYLGLLTFALAFAWIVIVYRRRAVLRATRLPEITAGLVTAFVVAFLFALPSPVGGVSMPSQWLWDRISAFRVPSRWDPLLMTVLLPLAALGLQAVWRALARRGRLVAVAAVAAAIAISFGELAVHTVPRFRTVPVPAEYVALKTATPSGVLAEYPLGYSDIYRLWQRVHNRPLVNGAPAGTAADQMRMVLLDPAQPGTAESLALLGVTAIELHPGNPADVPVQPREPTHVAGYRLVGRYPDGASVWDVVAAPAPALVVPTGGFLAPTRTGNGPLEFQLGSAPGTLELRAKNAGVIHVTFTATVQGGGSTTLHVGDGTRDVAVPVSGTTPVAVDVQVPRGRSEIFLRPEGSALVSVSLPRATASSGNPSLSALPLDSSPGF